MTSTAALETLFAETFPAIRAKCARMLGDGDDAEDVAQETFVRLWHSGEMLQAAPGARLAWIYRTSSRIAIDRIRRRAHGVEVRVADAGIVEAVPTAGSPEQTTNARAWLAAIVHSVPRDEVEALVLSRVDGMTHDEIAEVTAMSPRSVRRVLARADSRLRRLLQEKS